MRLGNENVELSVIVLLTVNVEAEEVFDGTIEVDAEGGFLFHATFEFGFYGIAFTEIDAVIDEKAKVDGWFSFEEGSGEDAGIVGKLLKSDGFKCGYGCFVPVARAAFETIEGFEK